MKANKNSISKIAPAFGVSFDYYITRRLSCGLNALVSYDIFEKSNSLYSIEPLVFARWYAASPTGEPNAGIFVEALCGPEIILVNSKVKSALSLGVELGFRMVEGSFYFEPTLRGGYPYILGFGFNSGFRF